MVAHVCASVTGDARHAVSDGRPPPPSPSSRALSSRPLPREQTLALIRLQSVLERKVHSMNASRQKRVRALAKAKSASGASAAATAAAAAAAAGALPLPPQAPVVPPLLPPKPLPAARSLTPAPRPLN
jgi:hypothetical protein